MNDKKIKVKCTLWLYEDVVDKLDVNYEFDSNASNLLNKSRTPNAFLNRLTIKGHLNKTFAYWKRTHTAIQFTKEQFELYYNSNEKFKKLFKKFTKSGYDKELQPSFIYNDVLQNTKVYTYKKRKLLLALDKGIKIYHLPTKTAYMSIKEACVGLEMNAKTISTYLKDDNVTGIHTITTKQYLYFKKHGKLKTPKGYNPLDINYLL